MRIHIIPLGNVPRSSGDEWDGATIFSVHPVSSTRSTIYLDDGRQFEVENEALLHRGDLENLPSAA